MATRPRLRERNEGRRARILADIYAADADALRRQARRHSPGHVDPEDAFQDACAEFLRYYEGPPGADAVRYLMAAVRHCAWARASCAAQRHGIWSPPGALGGIRRSAPHGLGR